MGLLDMFNELKERFSGVAEEAQGTAGEMLDGAMDQPIGDQVGEAAGNATEQVQENVENFKNESGDE